MMIKNWILASRLRTLPLALSCIIMGSACAYLLGGFKSNIFIAAIITTILLQILSNLANDYGDGMKGSDANRIGPERMLQSGKISPAAMKTAIIICAIASLLMGIYLIYLSDLSVSKSFGFLLIGIGALLAAVYYTIGKISYGYKKLGDFVVLVFFGLVGVVGVFYLYIHDFNISVLLPALCIGLCSVAVLHLNNMRDATNDLKAGKYTIANSLGMEKSKLYFHLLIFTALSSLFVFTYLRNHYFWNDYLYMIIYPVFINVMWKVQKSEAEILFDQFLKPIAISTFLLSCLFALSIYL